MNKWIEVSVFVVYALWSLYKFTEALAMYKHNSNKWNIIFDCRMTYTKQGRSQVLMWVVATIFLVSYLVVG